MRKIIHCDADCFFAAIEMRDDPSLREHPVAVGGGAEGRGVISTCNYKARVFGVHSAMPSGLAKRLCPDLIILPHRMDAYRDASLAMRRIFFDYTEYVEPLSLDEAFLDVSHSEHCRGSATLIAEEIRRRVTTEIGITVSAGVAPNRFLAKVASDWRKPDGLYVITPDRIDEFVLPLPVQKIHGVGKVLAARLGDMGVKTCGDLQAMSMFKLVREFGRMGLRLYQLSRGKDDNPVSLGRRRKSMSVEHTYPKDLPNLAACIDELPALLDLLSVRLAGLDGDYKIIKLFVKLKFADFTVTTLERAANEVSSGFFRELCQEAFERRHMPVRLLGLGARFYDLREDRAFHQLSLFNE